METAAEFGPHGPGVTARPRGSAGYANAAQDLARQYESVAFADVHRDVLHLLPEAPAQVLDVGAGSGRDAAALAALGHHVLAVEPTPELLRIARRLHVCPRLRWCSDALPELGGVRGEFDLVLLSAVWMHLDPRERPVAMRRIGGLLAPGGRIVLTLRHGPIPPDRHMWSVSGRETIAMGHAYGLRTLYASERADVVGRDGVFWSALVLERGPGDRHALR